MNKLCSVDKNNLSDSAQGHILHENPGVLTEVILRSIN